MGKKITFFKEAVRTIKTSGTLIPSSRFLVKKILKKIDFSNANVIVELGAGNGIITKEILKRIPPNTILICFEINIKFFEELQKIKNNQLIVLNASAEHLSSELDKLNFSEADIVISSLPMAILPQELSIKIAQNSYNILKKNGRFVQYQYSTQFLKPLKTIFKKEVKLKFEPLNFPPAFIYICKK